MQVYLLGLTLYFLIMMVMNDHSWSWMVVHRRVVVVLRCCLLLRLLILVKHLLLVSVLIPEHVYVFRTYHRAGLFQLIVEVLLLLSSDSDSLYKGQ